MSDTDWRGPVNQILYGLMFTPDLDDKTAAEMADAMMARRYFLDGPEVYERAIRAALATSEPLADAFDTPHNEEAFRGFLARLAARLAASQQ